MISEVGFVIQGPTTFCREVVACYSELPYLVWSTWEDEPSNNLTFIQTNMDLLVNEIPVIGGGFWNIHMQCISTYEGIKYLKNKSNT